MSQAFSKEELKAALLDLVQSDKNFVSSLMEELVLHLPAQDAGRKDKKQNRPTAKRISGKILPTYRQDIKKAYPKAGLSESAVHELRELFADAPPAEQIIEIIRK